MSVRQVLCHKSSTERKVPNCFLSQIGEMKLHLLKMQTQGLTLDLLNQNLPFNKVLGRFTYTIIFNSTEILDVDSITLIKWTAALKTPEELNTDGPSLALQVYGIRFSKG